MQRRSLIAAGLLAATATVAAPAASTGHAGAGTPEAPVFAHPVTVDAQRLAGEPDVTIGQGDGRIYASAPWGVSTNTSFLWRSEDGGESFRQVQGGVPGNQNPYAFRAGGDTEIQAAPPVGSSTFNRLYVVNQNNLDTLSCAYSDDGGRSFTFTTGSSVGFVCPDTVGADRQWLTNTSVDPTVTTNGGNVGHTINYLWYDHFVVGGNQLFRSDDGLRYKNGVGLTTTDSQGNPGNAVADPTTGVVYVTAPLSNSTGNGVVVGYSADGGKTLKAVTAVPEQYQGGTGTDFSVLAVDTSGNLYLVYTVQNGTGPWRVYETHTTGFTAVAPDATNPSRTVPVAGATAAQWSAPIALTGPGSANPGINYAVFPWITAGDAGRIDVAYYGTSRATGYDPNTQNAAWTTYMTQSVNALAAAPAFATAQVSEAPTHLASICFNGVGCTGQGNRNLLDFLEVQHDSRGAAVVVYNDDANSLTAVFPGGPFVMEGRQVGGQSLFAGVGELGGAPTRDTTSVIDRTGDGQVPTSDTNIPALDLLGTGAALDATGANLVVTFKVADLAYPTQALANDGGAAGLSYVLTWKYVDPTTGVPDVYFAAAHEPAPGGRFQCVAGRPQSVPFTGTGGPKFAVYGLNPNSQNVNCVADNAANTVTVTVPVAAVDKLTSGSRLLQASAVSLADRGSATDPALADQADTTPSFDDTLGMPATSVAEAPWMPFLPLAALVVTGAGIRRRVHTRRTAR